MSLSGGGYFHYRRWWGRAAGQGMIFTVINIGTGYLNRPNWLLVGYSVYHRVASRASQPTMFMTGPWTRRQWRCVRDAHALCLWQARDLGNSSGACVRDARAGRNRFRVFISFYCKTTIGQGIIIRGVQYCNRLCIWTFLVRYIVTGCIFCAPSGLRQGPVLTPSAVPPLPSWNFSPPPPPPVRKKTRGAPICYYCLR